MLVTQDGVVRVRPHPDASLIHRGQPLNGELELRDDLNGDPTILELGSLRFHLIRRGDRIGLRVRDTDAAALADFAGVPRFPVDPAWRVTATFVPADPTQTIPVPDVLGDVSVDHFPGWVEFSLDGEPQRLAALKGDEDGWLWLIFGDATNGTTTYGAGRFLYTEPPAADGTVVVDFNLAFNPPCVFSPYATCPLPPEGNRISVPIPAGEMLPAQPESVHP